jgi:hypothetical protein
MRYSWLSWSQTENSSQNSEPFGHSMWSAFFNPWSCEWDLHFIPFSPLPPQFHVILQKFFSLQLDSADWFLRLMIGRLYLSLHLFPLTALEGPNAGFIKMDRRSQSSRIPQMIARKMKVSKHFCSHWRIFMDLVQFDSISISIEGRWLECNQMQFRPIGLRFK